MDRPLKAVQTDPTPGPLPEDPVLRGWAEGLERIQWSALILDAEWRLVWVSSELRGFLGAEPDDDLGLGLHIAEAYMRDVYLDTVHPDNQVELFRQIAPFALHKLSLDGRDIREIVPERFHSILSEFLPLIAETQSEAPPLLLPTTFQYVAHGEEDGAPEGYPVNVCSLRLNADDGTAVGAVEIFFMGVRPNLLALLARGDEQMYERMARLVEPTRHQAAVLFCDLHQSMRLSRQLPTAAYFKLVRALWTGIDQVVADETGIVGKHAGDGASAYFLVNDLGSPSQAAAAAVRAARRIHRVGEEVFRSQIGTECMMKVGIHWGSGLYMGQLVPGGRLDVTALGDEVNETARVEECAPPGSTLVTKSLLEQLEERDCAALGIEMASLTYTPLSDLETATAKGATDAGTLPVTRL